MRQKKESAGTALTDYWRARCYQSFAEYSRALAVYEDVLPILKKEGGKYQKNEIKVLLNMGICYKNLNNKNKAREILNIAYKESRSLRGDAHPDTIVVKEELDKLDSNDE